MHVPSDQITATLENREFGTGVVSNATFQEPVPESLRVLAIQLREQSALLKLRPDATPEKQPVFDAYRADLQLLKGRIASFECCVKEAVHGSVIVGRKVPWAKDGSVHSTVEKLWQELKNEIPPIGQEPFLLLDYKLAAEPANDILITLQQQFERSIDQILRLTACWLHLLVEHNLVGLVEWTDTDVARYHYFVHDQRPDVLETKLSTETEVDNNQPYGQRTTYTNVKEEKVRTRRYLERHVHHIVNARVYDLETYPDKMPSRVAEFLEKVPDWMQPLLQIVAGEITTEEIVRHKVSDTTAVERTVESVFKASPAVTLGNFALVGWSSDDLVKETTGYYKRQLVGAAKHLKTNRLLVLAACITAPLVALALIGIIVLCRNSYVEAESKYAAYAETWNSRQIFTTEIGESLVLEGVEVPICFAGTNRSYQQGILLSRDEPTLRGTMAQIRNLNLPEDANGRGYGDTDLGPDFGIFVKLHVLEVSNTRIKYAVTYYGNRKDW